MLTPISQHYNASPPPVPAKELNLSLPRYFQKGCTKLLFTSKPEIWVKHYLKAVVRQVRSLMVVSQVFHMVTEAG